LYNGYGIETRPDGSVYHGEFRDDKLNGYGIMKYCNKNSYDGQWMDNRKNGVGVRKNGATGRIERVFFAGGNFL
jgi:hypothetical protein